MGYCNDTLQNESVDGEVPYANGLTFHELGLIISAAFGLASVVMADYLILQHAIHYLRPEEQKHIIRILFMIPVYSTVSFLSYYFYKHAIYFEVLRDCYEAFAIASFFTLMCNYIAPSLHDQKDFFRKQRPKNWIWPIPWLQKCTGGQDKGWLRKPASGLTWFNVIYLCVFQYCFIRVLFTIVSVVTQYFGRYCESSDSPEFAKIWVEVFEGVSVTIAMFALIQFYVQLKDELAENKPFLKLLCIKLVIFFSFWQSLVISFLSSSNILNPTDHIQYPDIAIGLPSLLLCCEMALFAVLHFFAFPWRKPYSLSSNDTGVTEANEAMHVPGSGYSGKAHYQGGTLGLRALLDAFNPYDIIKASARGFRWLFVGRKHRHLDESYQQDGMEPYSKGTKLQTMDSSSASTGSAPVLNLNIPSGAADGSTEYVGATSRNVVHGGYPESNRRWNEQGYGVTDAPSVHDGKTWERSPSTWQPDPEDDDAWQATIGPGQHSGRQSVDLEDHAGLLRNAMRPAQYPHSDDGA